MPQQEIGHIRVECFRQHGHGVQVGQHGAVAVRLGKVAVVGFGADGAAVAQMVVAGNKDAPPGQIFRQRLVAVNEFHHAVGQLDDGPHLPVRDTARMGMFKQYAEQLVAEGKAYYCFCTEERLEALHAEQRAAGEMTHYDGCCRELPKEEVEKRLAAGEPYVIRQKIPREGVTGFDDVVYGHIEVNNSEMDDQILIKTDGMPTYNFANVVDDHLMGITHVIRGSEYLSSTPKYNLLYQAFGWEIPTYIHCPPVMKDAQNKLSKRNGDASYQDLVAKGYLTEAVLNYICLLGWSPKGEYAEQEIFSLPELVKVWSPEGISKSSRHL